MAIWYVRTTGSDTNSGTSANAAFATIGKAMTQASLAAGDTIYVGAGTYRISTAIAPTSMASMTYLYGDTDGSKTGDAGEVLVSTFSSDTSAANAVNVFLFASKNYWTVGRMTLLAGPTKEAVVISGTSANLTLEDLTVFGAYGIVLNPLTFGTSAAVTIRRCRVMSLQIGLYFDLPTSASGADTNLAITVENCVVLTNSDPAIQCTATGSSTFRSGGITFKNNLISGAGASYAWYQTGVASTTQKLVLYNNNVIGRNGLGAASTTYVTEDYNVLSTLTTPRSNVTAGANSVSNARSWRVSLGHEASFGGVTRPFGELPVSSPLLTWGGTAVPTDDINGVARPASGAGQSSTQQALGPFERSNSGTRDASVYRTTSPSLLLTGPGYHDFELPVAASATTFTAYVRRDSNYAGTNPSISVTNGGECGVADATVTDTGSANAWNLLTLTFTPTTAGIVTIRFRSSSTAATGLAWIDDIAA